MTLTDVINQVFGDLRAIIIEAASKAGVRLGERDIDRITDVTKQALANELSQLENDYQQAFSRTVQKMIATERRRFM